jgi:small subunit ribosomal protein S6
MRNYELAFIIEPNIDEEGATGVVDKISQFVKSVNGEVASVDVWGRRRLAYPINNYREGTYVLVQTKMAPSAVIELERNLKLSEEIIRYLLIKVES